MTNASTADIPLEASPIAVVKLYDTIMMHINKAAAAADAGDYQAQFAEVMSATRIIDGLNRCLDMEKGGKTAQSLRDMYEAVSRALLRSVGKVSGAEACQRLVGAVGETRDAWATIAGVPLLNPSNPS